MARKIKTEQEKKKTKKRIIIIITILIVLIGIAVAVWFLFFNKEEPKKVVQVKELDNLGEYSYVLTDRDTDFYKSEFEVLKEIVNVENVDEEKYATQVARMFTIDLYTMSTKVNKNDIGGIEYIHKDGRDSFSKKVMYTLYDQMLDDTFGDREQVLPEVNSLETVSTEKMDYSVLGNTQSCYLTKLKIGYVTDLKYDTNLSVVVCQEADTIKWGVVDFQPTLTPDYTE